MCMDDVLKGVWSPKYYEDLEKALTEYYLENHKYLIKRIVQTNEDKATSIRLYMKHRAAYFFIISIAFILLSGYEATYAEKMVMPMFFLALWAMVFLFLNKLFFSSNGHTAIAVVLTFVFSVLFYWANTRWLNISIPDVWVVHIVLALLIAPIIWQAFVCWMFSSPYKTYIRNKLEKGKKSYKLAEEGINGHNPNIIPKKYIEMYNKEAIGGDNAEEAKRKCLDNYLELMENEITEASNPRSVFKILLSCLLFHINSEISCLAIKLHFRKNKTITQQ